MKRQPETRHASLVLSSFPTTFVSTIPPSPSLAPLLPRLPCRSRNLHGGLCPRTVFVFSPETSGLVLLFCWHRGVKKDCTLTSRNLKYKYAVKLNVCTIALIKQSIRSFIVKVAFVIKMSDKSEKKLSKKKHITRTLRP